MRRVLVPLVAGACLLSACTPSERPHAVSAGDVAGAPAGDEAGARAAAIGFLEAYADLPIDGPAALRLRSGPAWMQRWVTWLEVQRQEFEGGQQGALELRTVGAATPLPILDRPGDVVRQVSVDAFVTFDLDPSRGEPFQVVRSFGGPMLLVRTPDGAWLVTDFVRDGIPMSIAFQVIEPAETFGDERVEVELDSFVAAPVWQLHLRIRVGDSPDVSLTEDDVALVGADGTVVDHADVVSPSLGSMTAGARVPGIVTFPPQPDAAGLSLRLSFRSSTTIEPILIPLDGLIEPLPIAVSGSPSPEPGS